MSKQALSALVAKYKRRLAKELGQPTIDPSKIKPVFSREYKQFKKEYLPKRLSIYEKLCNASEKLLKFKVDPKREAELWQAISVCHLNCTPAGAASLAIVGPIILGALGALIGYALLGSPLIAVLALLAAVLAMPYAGKIPFYLADLHRLKASNQMVLCIFYVVTFMRHTSNLELAVEFAAEHLAPPLALDLKKVLWDVETGRYDSVKESLDVYLKTWERWNREFIESFHLVISSLYEPSEERRLTLLDKALTVILDETYEKMLHYAHNLKGPITMLHMMGIILPILGLVVLPLVVNFIEEARWYHLMILYNIMLPLGVLAIGKSILAKRPTGYGNADIGEISPEARRYSKIIIKIGNYELRINPIIISVAIGTLLVLGGLSPLIIHAANPDFDIGFGEENPKSPCGRQFCFLEYRESKTQPGVFIGPFGLGASIISVLFAVGVAVAIGLYFYLASKNLIKIRDNAKKLETEFASALFQLGNRLGDGLPAEIAFERVAGAAGDTPSGNFFKIVSSNITRLGLSVKEAIFNRKIGAVVYFPSKMIESSMKVLIESVKKGPLIAAQAVMNISRYIKEIHRVNERLRDLLADVVSGMKSQIAFLTPAIAGIVVGITSMVTLILGSLSRKLGELTAGAEASMAQSSLFQLFGDGIPTYFFQIIVGIYVVQITYILTVLMNGIMNGSDKLQERYLLGKNILRSTALYCVLSVVVMMLFNMVAARILMATMG